MGWQSIGAVGGICYASDEQDAHELIKYDITIAILAKVIEGKVFYAILNPENNEDYNYYNVNPCDHTERLCGTVSINNKIYVLPLPPPIAYLSLY